AITIDGNIDYNYVIDDTKLLIASNFPYYTKSWKINKEYSMVPQNFRFDVNINSLSPFDDLFNLEDIGFISLRAKGGVNTLKNEINIVGSFPELSFKGQKFYNGSTYINLLNQSGEVNFHSDSSLLQGMIINSYDIDSKILGDKINLTFSSKNLKDSIGRVEIKSEIAPHPKGYIFKILNSDLRIYNKRWKFSSENSVAFGKEFLEIKNFNFSDGNRTLEFADINNRGIIFKANKFKFDAVNTILKDKNFYFDGEVISSIRMNDIFEESPDLYGTLLINSLTINKDPYGDLNLDISKPLNENLRAILSIDHVATKQSIKSIIDYDTKTKYVNANIKGRKIPLKWLEYVLKDGIKNMKGDVDIDGVVNGPAGSLKVNVDGIANNGSVKVVYLGETYSFNNEKFKITQNTIDLTGAKLFDSERNSADITGGLRHKLFKDFSINATITSPRIIALNTTKIDNPIYYGVGKGSVIVDITGPTNLLNMVINAKTSIGTILNIPISENAINNSKGLITFVDRSTYFNNLQNGITKKVKVEGLQIEMNIDMTPEAQVNLIFDERVGDVIRGNGSGNIRVVAPRFDPLEIYGTFQIQKGEYLFTAKNLLAKPFIVREGGLIRWTGDPINAAINIEADYLVRTSVNTYLEEFLYTDNLRARAAARTAVNVTLVLGNTLFNPTINFNLDFPELAGELKNYATTKTRFLKNNEVDLNGQIFSL
nr:translocation/assembly module TamB domain-containing protein [Saprospiraceae bacterium]